MTPYPVGDSITQRFGENAAMYAPELGHPGVDFGSQPGTVVHAPLAGTVETEQVEDLGGVVLYLRHPWGRTYYAHLSDYLVPVGTVVQAGQPIALTGATGWVTGPHLHWGVYPDGVSAGNGYRGAVDPLSFQVPQQGGGSVLPLPQPQMENNMSLLAGALLLAAGGYLAYRGWKH